jgi:CheY-like chemotaxis protein
LVVDDHRDAADAVVMLLRLVGYDAAASYGGASAIETSRAFRPELVLMDIEMPALDGFAAAKALRREQEPEARLILLAHTARSDFSEEEARRAGFDGRVMQPVFGDTICELVSAYLPRPVTPLGNAHSAHLNEIAHDTNTQGADLMKPPSSQSGGADSAG